MALGKRLEYREICRPTLSSMEIVPIPTTLLSLFMLHLLKLGQPIAEESEKTIGDKIRRRYMENDQNSLGKTITQSKQETDGAKGSSGFCQKMPKMRKRKRFSLIS